MHVSAIVLLDPGEHPGGFSFEEFRRHVGVAHPPRAAVPLAPRRGAARARPPRLGRRTPTSTSTPTSDASASRRPVGPSRSATSSATSSPSRSTVGGRSGSSGSSRGSRAARSPCSRRSTTRSSTVCRAAGPHDGALRCRARPSRPGTRGRASRRAVPAALGAVRPRSGERRHRPVPGHAVRRPDPPAGRDLPRVPAPDGAAARPVPGATHQVQRRALPEPPVRVHERQPRRGEAGATDLRREGERRRARPVRRVAAALARRARRDPVLAAHRPGPGLAPGRRRHDERRDAGRCDVRVAGDRRRGPRRPSRGNQRVDGGDAAGAGRRQDHGPHRDHAAGAHLARSPDVHGRGARLHGPLR